jgi:hypothetical protein
MSMTKNDVEIAFSVKSDRMTKYRVSRAGLMHETMNADTLRRRCSRVSLSSFVILSIQRITRYDEMVNDRLDSVEEAPVESVEAVSDSVPSSTLPASAAPVDNCISWKAYA